MESSGGGGSTAPWRRQGSGGGGSSGASTPAPAPVAPPMASTPPTESGGGISVAPPPPPPLSGPLPTVRLSSEIGEHKGPPKALQGAMMKDKKPFTYTPGGIDLSEIRSPRMAKRIQMNAAAEGVTSVPTPSPHAPHYLPPAALAAMQPQIPISVLPPGALNLSSLHRTTKPNDFAPQQQQPGSPPGVQVQQAPNFQGIPPPPPMLPPSDSYQQTPPQISRVSPRPAPPTAQPVSLADVMKQSIALGSSQQARQPQQPPTPPPQQQPVPTFVPQPAQTPQQPPTRAQAVSQKIGSIYIPPPPIEQRPSVFGDRSQGPPMTTTLLQTQATPASGNHTKPVAGNHSKSSSIDSDSDQTSTPSTPQLNKAPTPWLTSQHHRKPNSPPTAGSNTTPWGPPLNLAGRTIPISIARDQDELEESRVIPTPKFLQQTTAIIGDAINRKMLANSARGIPNNRSPSASGNPASVAVTANGARVIPIQIQSSMKTPPPSGPATPQSASIPNNRPIGNTAYNSPRNLYSTQNVGDHNQQVGEALASGIDKLSTGGEEPAPVQSKSFRVLQKITDDVDDGSVQNTSEPRFRGGHIPSRAFQALRSHLPPSPGTQDAPPAFSTSRSGAPHVHNIQIRMAPSSPTPSSSHQQQQYQAPFEAAGNYNPANTSTGPGPAFYQHIPEPKMYTGGNIPSRSFKMLQNMTPYDVAALGESEAGVDQITSNCSSSTPQFLTVSSPSDPQPPTNNSNDSLSNGDATDSESEAPEGYYYIDPENPETWDPYTYWYYYWYYAVNYWNGVPPEEWAQYAEYYQQQPDVPVSIPSKAFKNLQKHFEDMNPDGACDKADLNSNKTTKAEQKEPESKLKLKDWKQNEETGPMDVIYEEDKETDDEEQRGEPEVKSGSESDAAESNAGIVEEPDTPSSDWSEDDAFTLTEENGIKPVARVVIEECLTDTDCESTDGSQHRLSTIDEMSETERSSIRSTSTLDLDSDSDSDSSDHASSASVIENRSSETFGCCSTTAKDETESSEDENPEIDGDIDDLDSAVTVRLPLRLSFSKSKSYRDIATVLVGCSEVQPSHTGRIKEEAIEVEKEDEDDENVNEVSYTVTLSRSGSKPKEDSDENPEPEPVSARAKQPEPEAAASADCTESTLDEKTVVEAEPIIAEKCAEAEEESPIDFWGEIMNNSNKMKKELLSPEHSESEEEVKAPEKAAEAEEAEKATEADEAEKEAKEPEPEEPDFWATPVVPVNFWEKQEVESKKFNFWESHQNFEFTSDYEQEQVNVGEQEPDLEEEGQAEDDLEEEGQAEGENTEDDCPTLNTQYEDLSMKKERPTFGFLNPEYDFSQKDKVDADTSAKNDETDPCTTVKSDPGSPSGDCPEKSFADASISVDETSDGSSSKSSGTITVKSDPPAEIIETTTTEDIPKPKDSEPHQHDHSKTNGVNTDCTCHASERSARAENLLWRIERFLKESLSLGSEDDSGVMTDTSRQMSDTDTDEGEPETGCTRAVTKEVTSKEAATNAMSNKDAANAAAKKAALSYQRAKTHSRLFQLLQEECGRDDEDEEELLEDHLADVVVIDTMGAGTDLGPVPATAQTTDNGRKGLLRTPAQNGFRAGSSSFDSSSPSGSSGLLSPSSREQVLVDIINQFQSRQNPAEPRRIPGFPSKVFKLLQQEFGEEFYDTFEIVGDEVAELPQVLLPCSQPEPPVTQCKVHKNTDSIKSCTKTSKSETTEIIKKKVTNTKIQETKSTHTARSTSTTNGVTARSSSKERSAKAAADLLEVPQKGQKLITARAKSTSPLSRDPRVPKPKKTKVKD